jgi:hypothetical protein
VEINGDFDKIFKEILKVISCNLLDLVGLLLLKLELGILNVCLLFDVLGRTDFTTEKPKPLFLVC